MSQFNFIRAILVLFATFILTDHFAYSTKIIHQSSSSGESTNLSSVASNGQKYGSKKRPIIDLNMPAQSTNSHSMESAHSVYKRPKSLKDTASSTFRQSVQSGHAAGHAFQGTTNKQQAVISYLHPHTSNPFPLGSIERKQETSRRRRQAALQRGVANKQRKVNPVKLM